MRSHVSGLGRVALQTVLWGILGNLAILSLCAQTSPYERAFPQSKATVEKALSAMQASLAGHLPVLDGFANPSERSLDHYQRGYYQAKVLVSSTPSGGSVVRISTKVTAWYADPTASRSGYQLLTSNGRLEADLLDQLAEQLADKHTDRLVKTPETSSSAAPVSAPKQPAPTQPATEPAISAPSPKFPATDRTFSSSLSQGLAAEANSRPLEASNADKATAALQVEANSLEEIVKNMAHPKNLVAIKKSGTPVVSAPSLTAKAQFMASMHDEFEMLDFNADWVHIRVSGRRVDGSGATASKCRMASPTKIPTPAPDLLPPRQSCFTLAAKRPRNFPEIGSPCAARV
jgi:hypothetical protein